MWCPAQKVASLYHVLLFADSSKDIDRSYEHEEASETSFVAGHIAVPLFSSQKVFGIFLLHSTSPVFGSGSNKLLCPRSWQRSLC